MNKRQMQGQYTCLLIQTYPEGPIPLKIDRTTDFQCSRQKINISIFLVEISIFKSEILLVVCCLKNLRFFPEKYEIFVRDFRLIYAAIFCYSQCVFSHAVVPLYRALLFALVQGMAVCPCAGHGCLIQLLFFRASHCTSVTTQQRAPHKCFYKGHCTSVTTEQEEHCTSVYTEGTAQVSEQNNIFRSTH